MLGRLLDPRAGHWALRPVDGFTTDREYVGDTLVLRTVFRTTSGVVTDALGLEQGARGHDIGLHSLHVLLRRVEGVTGSVVMRSELAPRMEYGRTEPNLHLTEQGC
ncbi:MAG: glycoside hydrolase family 15 protein, partial [Marmoricola sp.]